MQVVTPVLSLALPSLISTPQFGAVNLLSTPPPCVNSLIIHNKGNKYFQYILAKPSTTIVHTGIWHT